MYRNPAIQDDVRATLETAERNGFKLAMIVRGCALIPIGIFHPIGYQYPHNILIAVAILATALVGLSTLAFVNHTYEHISRYALFAIDMLALSALLAFVPISSGGEVPQNLVFLTSRDEYYLIVVAVSMLTLSPALVLWTGLCGTLGLAAATAWIVRGMDRMVSLSDLPIAPSREEFLSIALDPNFLALSARINDAINIAVVAAIAALAVHRARGVVQAHALADLERKQIRSLFGRYVPEQIVEQLIDAGHLAPQTRQASVVFADIEGFTRLSETLTPSQIVGVLNAFFGEAARTIHNHGGVVISYVGDALIAAFNAPLPMQDHSKGAVAAAKALLGLVSSQEFEGRRLRLRVGVATGAVAAGNVGTTDRQAYTIYGDTVNLSQRLEQMNKALKTECLICSETYRLALPLCADAQAIGEVEVRGRQSPLEIYAVNVRV